MSESEKSLEEILAATSADLDLAINSEKERIGAKLDNVEAPKSAPVPRLDTVPPKKGKWQEAQKVFDAATRLEMPDPDRVTKAEVDALILEILDDAKTNLPKAKYDEVVARNKASDLDKAVELMHLLDALALETASRSAAPPKPDVRPAPPARPEIRTTKELSQEAKEGLLKVINGVDQRMMKYKSALALLPTAKDGNYTPDENVDPKPFTDLLKQFHAIKPTDHLADEFKKNRSFKEIQKASSLLVASMKHLEKFFLGKKPISENALVGVDDVLAVMTAQEAELTTVDRKSATKPARPTRTEPSPAPRAVETSPPPPAPTPARTSEPRVPTVDVDPGKESEPSAEAKMLIGELSALKKNFTKTAHDAWLAEATDKFGDRVPDISKFDPETLQYQMIDNRAVWQAYEKSGLENLIPEPQIEVEKVEAAGFEFAPTVENIQALEARFDAVTTDEELVQLMRDVEKWPVKAAKVAEPDTETMNAYDELYSRRADLSGQSIARIKGPTPEVQSEKVDTEKELRSQVAEDWEAEARKILERRGYKQDRIDLLIDLQKDVEVDAIMKMIKGE